MVKAGVAFHHSAIQWGAWGFFPLAGGSMEGLPMCALRVLRIFWGGSCLLAFAAAVFALVAPATAQEGKGSLSGEAFGVFVDLGLLQVPMTPHVVLPPQGGAESDSFLELDVLAVASDTLVVNTMGTLTGGNAHVHSSAATEHVNILSGLITADLVLATSLSQGHTDRGQQKSASLSSDGDGVLVNLNIDGVAMGDVSPPPNTKITIPGVAHVFFNEQIFGGDGLSSTSLTVNMIRVEVLGGLTGKLVVGEIIVSSAHSGVNFVGDGAVAGDFVTGGGWIGSHPDFATFGFNAGERSSGLHGRLQYTDHAMLLNVHMTAVEKFSVDEELPCATFSGPVRVNGMDGFTATVTVCDFGEPGAGVDWFSIAVYDDEGLAYEREDILSGGNIQLHRR